MKKRILSLFMALTCLLSLASVSVGAAETEEWVTLFSDNFDEEAAEAAPANWEVYENGYSAYSETAPTAAIKEVSGRKYLQMQATCANNYVYPIVITKANQFSLDMGDAEEIQIALKVMASDVSNTRNSLRLSYPHPVDGTPYADSDQNDYSVFNMRGGGFRYLDGTGKNDAVTVNNKIVDNLNYTNISSVSANTWYDVTMSIFPTNDQMTFTIGPEGGADADFKTYTTNIVHTYLEQKGAIDSIAMKLIIPANGATMNLDDVSIRYKKAAVQAYTDNFDGETAGEIPSNWEVYQNDYGTETAPTLQISEENGNKFLRMTTTSAASYQNPIVNTKAGTVSLPLSSTNQVVMKMKVRTSHGTAGDGVRNSIRLGYPAPVNGVAYKDQGSSSYLLAWLRNNQFRHLKGINENSGVYPLNAGIYDDIESTDCYSISTNTWYDYTVVLDAHDGGIKHTIGPVDGSAADFKTYAASMDGTYIDEKGIVDNITLGIYFPTQAGCTMDVDDISIDYVPVVRSFSDDFESETAGSVPGNWEERNRIGTLTVLEEDGNKFARITKSASDVAKPPMVSSKTGKINIPYKEGNGKGIAIEAKIRPNSTAYRNLLMVSAPADINSTQYGQNYRTLFFTHTSGSTCYFLASSDKTETVANFWTKSLEDSTSMSATLGEWFDYRAVLLPDQDEILHYVNGNLIYHTNATGAGLPWLGYLDNLSFTWREYDTTGEGSMDFDDVKIYEIDETPYAELTYTKDNAAIESTESGTVMAELVLQNTHGANQYFVVNALYTKNGDRWDLSAVDPQVLNAEKWSKAELSRPITVTDPANQKIRTFVWYKDSLKPFCVSFELPQKAD